MASLWKRGVHSENEAHTWKTLIGLKNSWLIHIYHFFHIWVWKRPTWEDNSKGRLVDFHFLQKSYDYAKLRKGSLLKMSIWSSRLKPLLCLGYCIAKTSVLIRKDFIIIIEIKDSKSYLWKKWTRNKEKQN